MDFINNVRDKLSHTSKYAAQKAKDLSEIAKLKGAISNAEKQTSALYGNIGYRVYCAYHDKPLPEVEDLIKQVMELQQTIQTCKAQITAINTVDSCPQCGAGINKGMAFCSVCGNKLPAERRSAAEKTIFCSNCGAQLSAESMFCASCGQKIS